MTFFKRRRRINRQTWKKINSFHNQGLSKDKFILKAHKSPEKKPDLLYKKIQEQKKIIVYIKQYKIWHAFYTSSILPSLYPSIMALFPRICSVSNMILYPDSILQEPLISVPWLNIIEIMGIKTTTLFQP